MMMNAPLEKAILVDHQKLHDFVSTAAIALSMPLMKTPGWSLVMR